MEDGSLYRNKRFNAVGFSLTAIRIWQWTSSFFVYASFSLLYAHIHKNRLGENSRMKGVQILGLVSLVYSTFIICFVHIFKTLGQRSWRVFAIVSVPGDLTIMGICLAKITILSFSGVPADCHGLTRENYAGNDLVRQPTDGYDTIRFGSWSVETAGELDELCTFPRTVYGLSVFAIFSYTFSILLSVLYLQQQEAETVDTEKSVLPPIINSRRNNLDDVDRVIVQNLCAPSINQDFAASRRPPLTGEASFEINRPRSSSPSIATTSREGSFLPTTPVSPPWSQISTTSSSRNTLSVWGSSNLDSDTETTSALVVSGPSVQSHPIFECSGQSPRRWSISTTSSRNSNVVAATDRDLYETDPPLYSSRPGSLYHETMKYEAGLPLIGSRRP